MTNKEPPYTLNHEAMRQELRNKSMPSQECPNCNWMINPSRNADSLVKVLIDKDALTEVLMGMDSIITAFELDTQEPVEDVNKVLNFLTELANY